MWVFPLLAAVVAFAFAGRLAVSWGARRAHHELAWIVALAMFGVASLAVVSGVASGWTTTTFAIYWALGAVLNVPFLAGGEMMLLFRARWVAWATWLVLIFVTAFTVSTLQGATMDTAALAQDLPLGREVFGAGTPAQRLAPSIAYPAYVLLVAGALWSAIRMRGRPGLRNRFLGTLLIAVGATVVAAGAAFAVNGLLAGFSATLAAGITLMFLGFLRASKVAAAPEAVASP
jgi:hypothetical protein